MSELKTYEPHKSSIGGLDANVAALLACLIAVIMNFIGGAQWFMWIVPLIFFLMEKDSMLVKSHAIQAFTLGVVGAIIYIILDIIWSAIFVGSGASLFAFGLSGSGAAWFGLMAVSVIKWVVEIIIAIFLILAMVNAYKYKEYKISWISGLTEKFAAKLNKNKS